MAGSGSSDGWIYLLVVGTLLIGAGMLLATPIWLHAVLLGIGGLAVVFGSCETMIKSVDAVGDRLGWNPFVAGTMAGLASNIPELVMLGFVLVAAPRVGFIVTALTLHIGALVFGLYSGLLPRDQTGRARLPAPLVKISSDLYVIAACLFLGIGLVMLSMHSFNIDAGLGALDLTVIGSTMLFVQVVATRELLKRFRDDVPAAVNGSTPGWGKIAGFAALGLGASVLGGHAVGDFADILVAGVESAGYPPMVGAIILSLFASSGALAMVATSHAKGKHDVALAAASGQVTQVPFVVLPITLLLLAGFQQFGVIPTLPSGAVLPIDLETTSVMLLSFPPMLLLWKAAQDDGHVSWLETAGMVCVFGIVVYLLAAHG